MAASFSFILINLRLPIGISLDILNGWITTYWLQIFYCTSTENENIMFLYPMILTSTRVIRFWNNLNDIHCIYFAGFVTGKDIENVYILTITQYSCISIHSILLLFDWRKFFDDLGGGVIVDWTIYRRYHYCRETNLYVR